MADGEVPSIFRRAVVALDDALLGGKQLRISDLPDPLSRHLKPLDLASEPVGSIGTLVWVTGKVN
ncbi:MAG: hypothetical protein JO204_03100, partial [Alphaproteobacteria bacterium]|nr:hypothetical protein [Alphaproteobacteria bacterium]